MKKKSTLVAVATCGVVLATAAPVAGYNTFGDHRLTYGVVNQQYWIDSSASSLSGINTAFSRWNATSTPASWSHTTVQANSHIDTYLTSTVHSWWGITDFYVSTTQLSVPPTQNWWWAKIRLDGDWANCPNKTGVIGHEIGHAMGLAHVDGGNPRLMRTDIANLSTNTPWPDDVAGINHLY
jgi:hypothetical protein